MANNILFIFEGQRTEKMICDSLTKYFLNENTIVTCAYCNDIYELYKFIIEDEDLDTFELLKEIQFNKQILSGFNRHDFAEIYMFFDYDGHDEQSDDKKIEKLLKVFNEETEAGKLFISYPMDEALKHIPKEGDFESLTVDADAKRYKELVGKYSKTEFQQYSSYDRKIWSILIQLHLSKLNFIINKTFSFPKINYNQAQIFESQRNKYISANNNIAVLSAFPVFLSDYYGVEYISIYITKFNV